MSHNEADARARSKHADEMALINSAVQMVNSQLVNSSILQQQQGAGSHVGNSLGLGSGAGASGPTGFFDQYTMPPPPPPQVKNSNYANNNTFGGYGNSAAAAAAAAADRGYGGSNVYAPSTKLNPNAPHFNSGGPADPFVRAPGGQGPIRTSPTAQQGKFNNNFNSRHQYSSPMQQHQQPQQQQGFNPIANLLSNTSINNLISGTGLQQPQPPLPQQQQPQADDISGFAALGGLAGGKSIQEISEFLSSLGETPGGAGAAGSGFGPSDLDVPKSRPIGAERRIGGGPGPVGMPPAPPPPVAMPPKRGGAVGGGNWGDMPAPGGAGASAGPPAPPPPAAAFYDSYGGYGGKHADSYDRHGVFGDGSNAATASGGFIGVGGNVQAAGSSSKNDMSVGGPSHGGGSGPPTTYQSAGGGGYDMPPGMPSNPHGIINTGWGNPPISAAAAGPHGVIGKKMPPFSQGQAGAGIPMRNSKVIILKRYVFIL